MKKFECLLCDSFEGLFRFKEGDLVLDLEENGDYNGGIWGDNWEKRWSQNGGYLVILKVWG